MENKFDIYETDVLIIGGGTAGCFCALTLAENSDLNVIISEKANIKRSGCLAAGVNALNAHINEGESPESYVEYVKKDFNDVVREDLIYSMAKKLNKVTKKIEELGLPILKDKNGNYAERGRWNIKINGENIKPVLAEAVGKHKNIKVLNNLNIVDYIKKDNKIIGAIGFSVKEEKFVVIYAQYTVCAAGGAAGLYKPNNPQNSPHKMWYSPFNTGAGYAIGIRAGAEMTSFEMRFIALRCKNTIAPTGTISLGVKAPQINRQGEEYLLNYSKNSTSTRLYATVQENRKGNNPCYLKTKGITQEQENELIKAYLNMAPSQTLSWYENDSFPSVENVEIEGTEPYITGGHAASGYWIDINRKTTLENLYAIGDVAGGSPHKYVTGCFAEGEIAAESIIKEFQSSIIEKPAEQELNEKFNQISRFLKNPKLAITINFVEKTLQETMDKFVGGISEHYEYSKSKLNMAKDEIQKLFIITNQLKARDFHELMLIHEIIDRLYVGKVLIEHLLARKETRWHCYQENTDFPDKDDKNCLKYINSKYKNGEVGILTRDLITKEEHYEHTN